MSELKTLTWIGALKEWNKGQPSWCIPRRDTTQYKEVRALMEGKPAITLKESKPSTQPVKPSIVPMSELTENYMNRINAIEKYTTLLNDFADKKSNKAKQWFTIYIKKNNKLFNSEQEEYEYVNAYPKGQWGILLDKGNLTTKEQKELVSFAQDFGAMDY